MRTIRSVLLGLLAGAALPLLAAPAATPYSRKSAEAARLASEKSWALARDAYDEALRLAPDAATARWTRLQAADAAWRAAPSLDAAATGQHHQALTALIAEAESNPSRRDDFWVAVRQSRAELVRSSQASWNWNELGEWLAIGEFLAGQLASPAASQRYLEFLQHAFPSAGEDPAVVELFLLGARVAASADDRAWCAIRAADSTPDPAEPAESRWAGAVALAQGTRWAAVARAKQFVWASQQRRLASLPKIPPGDYRPLLAELDAIQAGLPAGSGEPLTADVRGYLENLRRGLVAPSLEFQFGETHLPGQPLRVSLQASGFGRLQFRLLRFGPEAWLRRRLSWPSGDGTMVREWTALLPDPEAHGRHTLETSIPALEPGFYALAVEAAGPNRIAGAQHRLFIVSTATVAGFVAGDGSGSALLTSATDGSPRPGVEVTGVAGSSRQVFHEWKVTSDAGGVVRIPAHGTQRFEIGAFAALADGQPVFLPYYYTGEASPVEVDAFLDRPLYRPGETVRWKLLIRELKDGALVRTNRSWQMTVEMHGEKLLDRAPLSLNAFGAADGSIALPASVRPGQAVLSLAEAGQDRSERGEFFTVDNYVPPAIGAELTLESGPDSLRPGREMAVRLKAEYLSGGPVAGALVEATLRGLPAGRQVRDRLGGLVADPSDGMLRAATDSAGIATLRRQLPDGLGPRAEFHVDVRVIPPGGQPVLISRAYTLTPAGALADAGEWIAPRLAAPGARQSFTARILDGTGEPRPLEGRARLIESRWSEVWADRDGQVRTGTELAALRRTLGLGPNQEPPAPWRRLESGMSELTVAEAPVRAGADGRIAVDFTVPRVGLYHVVFVSGNQVLPFKPAPERPDRPWQWGFHPATPPLAVAAVDAQTSDFPLAPAAQRVFGPTKAARGEPLRLFLVLPEGQRTALVSLQGEDTEITQRVELPGRAGLVVLDRLPPAANRVLANIAAVGTGGPSMPHAVEIDHAGQRLAVQVIPREETARPGSTSELRVSVRDAGGRPVRAEVALAGSDEAVNRLGGLAVVDDPSFWTTMRPSRWRFVRMPPPEPVRSAPPGALDVLVTQLNPFEVASLADESSFRAMSVGSGSRLALDLGDTPVAYSVIDRQFIDSLGITSAQGAQARLPLAVRRHFASTVLWSPSLVTDERGEASVPLEYADNLTRWRFEAYAAGADGGTFGRSRAFTQTTLPLQARLQVPRFLVAGDSAQPSVLLVNRTDRDLTAEVGLVADGAVSTGFAAGLDPVAVPRQGQAQVGIQVTATRAGIAQFSGTARAGTDGDAMQIQLPVREDGIQQLTAATVALGTSRRNQAFTLRLPNPLERARTQVSVQLSPSYAATILDAIPYLVDYPYGCVEQTMSRFLPAVVARKALVDLGLNAAAVEERMLGRESVADFDRRQASAGIGRLDAVVRAGIARLASAQAHRGGFGWWPGAAEPDPWMTAYVLWGASVALAAGVELPEHFEAELGHAAQYLMELGDELPDAIRPGHAETYGSLALALAAVALQVADRDEAEPGFAALFDRIHAVHDQLPPAGRAALLLAAQKLGTAPQRAELLRNVENGARHAPGAGLANTVHWGSTQDYWHAMDGAVETTALMLLALLEIDPGHRLIEPAANWLLLNRRSAHWDSTRSTAFAVLALTRFIVVRQEGHPDATAELRVNGRAAGRVAFNRDSLLAEPARIAVDPALLRGGENRLELVRLSGRTPVYATALGSAWAHGSTVKPAGNLVAVARDLDRMKPELTLRGVVQLSPQPLSTTGVTQQNEQVAARVRLEVPNDLEYVMVEVPKPAGCEPLNALSGWDARLAPAGESEADAPIARRRGRAVYREEHDDRTVFFLDRLPAGTWEIHFMLRAITPGDFRVLPAVATAMYVPEVRANSDARRLRIESAAGPR